MQIREEDLTLAHPVMLTRGRFLDLEDQFTEGPDLVRALQDASTRARILMIGDGRAGPRAALEGHLVAEADQLAHPCRGDGHTVLVIFDLARHADVQGFLLNAAADPCAVAGGDA